MALQDLFNNTEQLSYNHEKQEAFDQIGQELGVGMNNAQNAGKAGAYTTGRHNEELQKGLQEGVEKVRRGVGMLVDYISHPYANTIHNLIEQDPKALKVLSERGFASMSFLENGVTFGLRVEPVDVTEYGNMWVYNLDFSRTVGGRSVNLGMVLDENGYIHNASVSTYVFATETQPSSHETCSINREGWMPDKPIQLDIDRAVNAVFDGDPNHASPSLKDLYKSNYS